MRLRELAAEALGHRGDLPDLEVTGVSQDHQRVEPGHVFVARKGSRHDGHRFARLAIERGAVAVVGVNRGVTVLPWNATPYLSVADDRVALARLAARFYGHPSRRLTVVGVTGTDGKTTTSFLLHHLLGVRWRCGLLSTAAIRVHDSPLPLEGHFTTPEATEVQRLLSEFEAGGCSHAVVESSSHALAMRRLDEVDYDVAVWTNLTPEHLDFHGSFEAYLEAKAQLVRRARVAVLNRDDPNYPAFAAAAASSVGYGTSPKAEWRAERVEEGPGGTRFVLHAAGEERPAFLPMPGAYNVHNALAALAAAQACGLGLAELLPRLESFGGVPGRMQLLQSEPFAVVVDFAHTGPALEKALAALRRTLQGRLLLVVGAAGERDPGKRRPLGAAAAGGADLIFFTEEDSRSEDLESILGELEAGALAAGAEPQRIRRVGDRREAIAAAIAAARPGDVVLLAGKGHETTLERLGETLPWDEAAEARRHLGPAVG